MSMSRIVPEESTLYQMTFNVVHGSVADADN
jgi:hypothetical protein